MHPFGPGVTRVAPWCLVSVGGALLGTRMLLGASIPGLVVGIIVGGALYSMGAVTLATRRPDPVPLVFGYHEVWHVFTLAGAACHFALVLSILRDAGGA